MYCITGDSLNNKDNACPVNLGNRLFPRAETLIDEEDLLQKGTVVLLHLVYGTALYIHVHVLVHVYTHALLAAASDHMYPCTYMYSGKTSIQSKNSFKRLLRV